MILKVGSVDYELSTKLAVAQKIEAKYKAPFSTVFDRLMEAEISELLDIFAIAVRPETEKENLREDILEMMDYTEIQTAAQEFAIKVTFNGTPEQLDRKLQAFPADEETKKGIRGMLGLPAKQTPAEDSQDSPVAESAEETRQGSKRAKANGST